MAMLACIKFGLPESAASAMELILRLMKYRVRTAHGVSDDYYTSTALDILCGTGQGSGASPLIWAIISSIMILILGRMFRGFTTRDPTGTVTSKRPADTFVDNTNQMISGESNAEEDMEQMLSELEQGAQKWEELLFASGGGLQLKKCFWQGVFWKWHNGKPQMATSEDFPATIEINDTATGAKKTIKRLEPDDAQ